MKILGIQTGDFSVSYDLVEALRAHGVPFVALGLGDEIPPQVGVVITTTAEAPTIAHPYVLPLTTIEETLARALGLLLGPGPFRRVVVGIDPGERPGIAVLADGRVLRLIHARGPEAVREAVETVLASVQADVRLIRVGNGAPTFRDRILASLSGVDARLEVVDERRTTPSHAHGAAARDTAAATHIALTVGEPVRLMDFRPTTPTPGELRNIQRKSRLASDGSVTISRHLARHVALGRLTLDQALDRQREKA